MMDVLGPLLTIAAEIALIALLYRYLFGRKVRRGMYYLVFIPVGLCFGLGFALLNGATRGEQYALALFACGAIALESAWIATTHTPPQLPGS
jgi:hypothetical protein